MFRFAERSDFSIEAELARLRDRHMSGADGTPQGLSAAARCHALDARTANGVATGQENRWIFRRGLFATDGAREVRVKVEGWAQIQLESKHPPVAKQWRR